MHLDTDKKAKKKSRAFAYGLVFAVFLHGSLLGFLYWFMFRFEKVPDPARETIDVSLAFVDSPRNRSPKMVVAPSPNQNEEAPKKARFLSEKASKAKEDVSGTGNFQKNRGTMKKSDPLGLYKPSPGGEEEHIVGTKKGKQTALSAWQYQHAPFFNRIKERIGARWNPSQAIRQHDPDGTLIGQTDRVTGVQVTIDKSGRIVEVKIIHDSGVEFLDDEAMRATKGSGPYINPPSALFEGGQYFTFDFGFYLSISRGTSFDFDW